MAHFRRRDFHCRGRYFAESRALVLAYRLTCRYYHFRAMLFVVSVG